MLVVRVAWTEHANSVEAETSFLSWEVDFQDQLIKKSTQGPVSKTFTTLPKACIYIKLVVFLKMIL